MGEKWGGTPILSLTRLKAASRLLLPLGDKEQAKSLKAINKMHFKDFPDTHNLLVPDTRITHWRGAEALNRPTNIIIDFSNSKNFFKCFDLSWGQKNFFCKSAPIRNSFKKKCNKCYIGGGSCQSKWYIWVKNGKVPHYFSLILAMQKIQKKSVLTFLGGKIFFCKSAQIRDALKKKGTNVTFYIKLCLKYVSSHSKSF